MLQFGIAKNTCDNWPDVSKLGAMNTCTFLEEVEKARCAYDAQQKDAQLHSIMNGIAASMLLKS